MKRVVGGKRYDTESATLLASDRYWDGHNFERYGRNMFLYRTAKGTYFTVTETLWVGELDHLEPVSPERARSLYEGPLCEHEVEYEVAFPDVVVEDA